MVWWPGCVAASIRRVWCECLAYMFNFPNNLISSTRTDNQIKSDRSKYPIYILFLPPIFISSLKLRRFDLAHARRQFVRSPKGQFHHLHTLADTRHLSIGKQFNLLETCEVRTNSRFLTNSKQIASAILLWNAWCSQEEIIHYGEGSLLWHATHAHTHHRFQVQVDASNGNPFGQ